MREFIAKLLGLPKNAKSVAEYELKLENAKETVFHIVEQEKICQKRLNLLYNYIVENGNFVTVVGADESLDFDITIKREELDGIYNGVYDD